MKRHMGFAKNIIQILYFVCVLSCFSHVCLCANLWTVAYQPPLSMRFSRKEYWSVLSCPPPTDLPNPGIKPMSLMFPALSCEFFTLSPCGRP